MLLPPFPSKPCVPHLAHTVIVLLMCMVQWAVAGYTLHDDLPKPCCFPYRFQAIITPLARFKADTKVVQQLHRDWERRLQIQDTWTYTLTGLGELLNRVYMDYNTNIEYVIRPKEKTKCVKTKIQSGMLEPCMPFEANYLGESYLGFSDNRAQFQTFNFRRTDKNRNIEMTVSVTSDFCAPVMEIIQGTIAEAPVNTLVLFSNFTRDVDESVFQLPESCLE